MRRGGYVGIMTGTSLDAVNAVLCDGDLPIAQATVAIPRELAEDFRRLDAHGALADAMDAANAMTHLCAQAFLALSPSVPIVAAGCHGQTVLHRPERGWTLQLLNGALLAELIGVDVVCDFRSRDVAAGGQGAPLAPLFHRVCCAAHLPCAVVNLGGIANISVLGEGGDVRGWDICPANMLLDGWYRRCCGGGFDEFGEWAKSGVVVASLLQQLRAHPFLALLPPKSCGREQFDLRYFEEELSRYRPQDAQATLLEWSALEIAAAIDEAKVSAVFLCGGGANNRFLVARLSEISAATIQMSDVVGIAVEQMEAAAFAWLAKQFMNGIAVDTAAITGASGARILGAHYPALGRLDN